MTSKNRPVVLLVDEDVDPMKYYVKALHKHFELRRAKDPDEAWHDIETIQPLPDVIILDVMLPPKRYSDRKDVKQGIRTGLLLYDDLMVKLPQIKVIVLTNSGEGKIEFAAKWPEVPAFEKVDTTPSELVEHVFSVL